MSIRQYNDAGTFSTTLSAQPTANRNIIIPDIDGTLATLDGTETLSNKTLVDPDLGTPLSGTLTNCTFPILNQDTTGTSSNVTGIVLGAKGGTGVANTGKTITLGGNLTTAGAFATTLTSTAATNVTLPTTGTLATLAGAETLSNKTLVAPALGTPASGVMTNVTGTATGLTSGNVITNANLTGHITSVGNATVLGSFTSAQLATALTDETGTGVNVFATSPTLVTPNIGVATGTSFNGITGLSSTTPNMDGIANIGTSTTVALADHIHPTDTSKQDTLVSGTSIKTINGNSLLGSGDINISGGSGTSNVFIQTTQPTPATGVQVFWIKPDSGSFGLYIVTGD